MKGVSVRARPSIAELRVGTNRDKWLQITPLLPPSLRPTTAFEGRGRRTRISCSARNDKIDVDLTLTFASVPSFLYAQLLLAENSAQWTCNGLRAMNYTSTTQTTGHCSWRIHRIVILLAAILGVVVELSCARALLSYRTACPSVCLPQAGIEWR